MIMVQEVVQNQNMNDAQLASLNVLVIQDGVQDGVSVLKHAYFIKFMSAFIL